MAAKAHLHLIKYALKKGCVISVHDTEIWEVKQSTSYAKCKAAIEQADGGSIRIRACVGGEILGWAGVIIDGPSQEPSETVYDHSANAWMDEWWETYKRDTNWS